MLRVTKLADYGIVMLTFLAAHSQGTYAARDVATLLGLPLPVASKVLKMLGKAGILISQRGNKGGYALSRPPGEITLAGIITALEGPIAVTQCERGSDCGIEPGCPVRTNWHLINRTIQAALEKITLAEMTRPLTEPLVSLTGLQD